MYIEFSLPNDRNVMQPAIPKLHNEIRRWASEHNIDYSTFTVQHNRDRNSECVYLRSDRAYELFCISWNPSSDQFKKFTIRRD